MVERLTAVLGTEPVPIVVSPTPDPSTRTSRDRSAVRAFFRHRRAPPSTPPRPEAEARARAADDDVPAVSLARATFARAPTPTTTTIDTNPAVHRARRLDVVARASVLIEREKSINQIKSINQSPRVTHESIDQMPRARTTWTKRRPPPASPSPRSRNDRRSRDCRATRETAVPIPSCRARHHTTERSLAFRASSLRGTDDRSSLVDHPPPSA